MGLEKGRPSQKTAGVSCDELKRLRRLVGALVWVGSQTRPDTAAGVSMVQSARAQATAGEIIRANKVVGRLKATGGQGLRFACVRGPAEVFAFTDASLQNAPSEVGGEDKVYSQGG